VDLGCGLDAALLRHVYSTLAETFLAFGRIDFAARFRWRFDLLETRAIAGSANNFRQNLTRLFHNDQSSNQQKKLNFAKNTAIRATAQRNSLLDLNRSTLSDGCGS
jgi:hypothetical protein